MTNTAKVCFISGARADYGLLYWIMRAVAEHPALRLQVAVTGMHLSPAFGETVRAIEEDGFSIDARIDSLLANDSANATSKSIGLGTIGFADVFDDLNPDVVFIPGDRFEILAAAIAAHIAGIRIAHLAGGDVTEGAFDDAIRHSITKMAHLHFVTNDMARRRVIQMGESADTVHLVGNPGLDHLHNTQLFDTNMFEAKTGYRFREKNFLVTYHPETRDTIPVAERFQELLTALRDLDEDVGILFTRPNADSNGLVISRMTDKFVAARPHAHAIASLGQPGYFSALALFDMVIGNSSSGLYEAPSFGIPTVNVGDRQKGRVRASSVLDCPHEHDAIRAAILKAMATDCSDTTNPYGDGRSAQRIVDVLALHADNADRGRKCFNDLEWR